ncbi:hypothetical protein D3C80_1523910 [compost metagenome]
MTDINAVMPDKIVRGFRGVILLEIGGRRHHAQSPVPTDPYRHHVLVNRFAQAYAGIKALLDDIGKAVIDTDFNIDLRVFFQKICQHRPDKVLNGIIGTGQANRPGRCVPHRPQLFQLIAYLLE